jgi:hypothetical protein
MDAITLDGIVLDIIKRCFDFHLKNEMNFAAPRNGKARRRRVHESAIPKAVARAAHNAGIG